MPIKQRESSVTVKSDWMVIEGMEHYEKAYDRVYHTVTTTDDPIIRKLARTDADANVFATDSILATMMCCTRTQYSWDIVVQKIGGKIFLDKRDNTEFDL